MVGGAIALAFTAFWFVAWKYASPDGLRANVDAIQGFGNNRPILAGLAFGLTYAGLMAACVPVGTLLSLLAGALFGVWVGAAIVCVSAAAGACGAMLLSRYFFRDWAASRFGAELEPIQKRIDADGPFYLFALRLTPFVPFTAINLSAGLTRMAAWPFTWVTCVGLIPSSWLYANAGSALGAVEAPHDLLSPAIIGSLFLLGVIPIAFKLLLTVPRRKLIIGSAITLALLLTAVGVRCWIRYRAPEEATIAIREFTNNEYPEDPIPRSIHHGQYNGRQLVLRKRDETHFDFVFRPLKSNVAQIEIKNVDVGLMTPSLPAWTKGKPGIERIALTERQWNRQQVGFGGAKSPLVTISEGDGFESRNLFSAELIKNGLSAGLWEVMLYTQERGDKSLYYHGWFSFPLGHYKALFEKETGLSYWKNWHYLEHWSNPDGTRIKLDELRTVVQEQEARCSFDPNEPIIAAGEQSRRRRTTVVENAVTWKDLYDGRPVRFASLVAPGRYTFDQLHGSDYTRIDQFERALVRDIRSPADNQNRSEIELVFGSTHRPGKCRFLVSGFRWEQLPAANIEEYPRGRYYPMGIGVPPFFQTYTELSSFPPDHSPYFSLLVDEDGHWIDHRRLGIDGPIIHRDAQNPNRAHLYLMSYERHMLVGHWVIDRGVPATAYHFDANSRVR
jgi:uncharacterized membrane protein YdjX (TVP38/TMEM64 family)